MATFDTTVYADVMRQRLARIVPAMQQARQQLAPEAQAMSRQQMEKEIYAKPEDISSTGRKKWERTRDLIDHERGVVRAPDSVVLTNDQVYARRRHEANKSGYPFHVAPARTAHWRDDLAEPLLHRQTELYREAILKVLSDGASTLLSGSSASETAQGGGGGGGGGSPERKRRPKKPAAPFRHRSRF